ncbi:hypothetical protein GON26_12480 [Flavobacterium sp. GA093]|uniref:Uncharacterized protein n=1 Tax=Flavobacterium hydrocarbonoxydans TaxID=2683249 RepID=A0A6I4NU21_9FLAO|nr:hypothetical protein [Flavobacterium hydrocarbonoxydans]MWB95179.1 hypothetical protein [Flavobacterium hydrocarbonoxydans]
MKKNKISFGTNFWSAYEAGNPYDALHAFFDFSHLDEYKQILSGVAIHSYRRKIYKQDNPCHVFVIYTALGSFIKVCNCLKRKSRKWQVEGSGDFSSIIHLASLSKEEYKDPFKVFQKAFEEISLEQFESFLCEIVHISLSPRAGESDYDIITPYIYLIKMLDAGQLSMERGIEKIKKKKLCWDILSPVE